MMPNKNRFDGCTLTILGDSYSTFAGHNPDGYDVWYPNEGAGVDTVEKTWWRLLIARHGMTLLHNNSWSGSTVCTNVREEHPVDAAFVNRVDLALSGEHKPDLFILFGGTNDSWTNCAQGRNMADGFNAETDRAILPAFCHILADLKRLTPKTHVLCIVNTELQEDIAPGLEEACRMHGAQCLLLHDIDKIWGHPTALGMAQIADQVSAALEEA